MGMPIVNTSQARVDLTMLQADAIAKLVYTLAEAHEERPVVGVGVEETNLRGTVALVTGEMEPRIFMIAGDGDVHELGGRTV
jgi:hypothetical protein